MPNRSRSNRSKHTSDGAVPVRSASAATVLPTAPARSALRTPLISIVAQSATQPWQPSLPTCSSSNRIRSRVAGSASWVSCASGPPVAVQLGSSETSVVAPGRYG